MTLFSDSCGGQNRNINMCAMLPHAVQTMDIPTINQCFSEPGHSQMEADSIHGCIEKKNKRVNSSDPVGWFTAVRMASQRHQVIAIDSSKFLNFTKIQKENIKNRKTDVNGETGTS